MLRDGLGHWGNRQIIAISQKATIVISRSTVREKNNPTWMLE